MERAICFIQSTNLNVNPVHKPPQTQPEIMFNQISGHTVAQSS